MSLSDEIIYGTVESVERALYSGAPVNVIDEYGFTPLIQCAIEDNTEKARLLLQHGADPNFQDTVGSIALHWAVENHNLLLCRLLLEQGSKPNAYTYASQPILVKPLLRQQHDLKQLLYRYGADLTFAQDFINTKLIGHRFELVGHVDLVDSQGKFSEIDFEGFFLEFTLGIIQNSLEHYKNNFAARKLRHYFEDLKLVIHTLGVASELIKYQQYRTDLKHHQEAIDVLIRNDLLLIPVGYEGHAVTFIKCGDFFAKCDRGEESRHTNNSVTIYHVNNPYKMTSQFIKSLIYEKQTKEFILNEIPRLLDLQPLTDIYVESQLSGNCSWANVEASVPTMLFLISYLRNTQQDAVKHRTAALSFFHKWRDWDKDRALHYCMDSFWNADPIRKISKAAILAAVLAQRCNYAIATDVERAKRILKVLQTPDYEYILKTYVKVHLQDRYTEQGENLLALLKACDYPYQHLFQ